MSDAKYGYEFIGEDGEFEAAGVAELPELYFPLMWENGLKAAVSPCLAGDVKKSQHAFLTPPAARYDLWAARATRNVWVRVNGKRTWSAVGRDTTEEKPELRVRAGFLYHRIVSRRDATRKRAIEVKVTDFVPPDERSFCTLVTATNTGRKSATVELAYCAYLYGRDAENLRDHRQVTSLLNETWAENGGAYLRPRITFDERGHRYNETTYAVVGRDEKNRKPARVVLSLEEWLGARLNPDAPAGLFSGAKPAARLDGDEAVAALEFAAVTLAPGESCTVALWHAIGDRRELLAAGRKLRYGDVPQAFERTRAAWRKRLAVPAFRTGDAKFNSWIRWVALQPHLRKITGNSFLPDFDYGKGSRGWRDLWQDALNLIVTDPAEARRLILNNWKGLRLDGTNATIIGEKPGEFLADRNNIVRVWMDHGTWPVFTTLRYLHATGDFGILGEEATYFRDGMRERGRRFLPGTGATQEQDAKGRPYGGSLVEHMLLALVTAYHDRGRHGNLLLRDADWNDGLDMGRTKGESVAFTAFYGRLALELAEVIEEWAKRKGPKRLAMLAAIEKLLPGRGAQPGLKVLARYGAEIEKPGRRVRAFETRELVRALRRCGEELLNQVDRREWLEGGKGKNTFGFFNGYYTDAGVRLDGKRRGRVYMNLTGQAFPLMAGLPRRDEKARLLARSVLRNLYDARCRGIRLNTRYDVPLLDMGRALAFSFGDKENGAVFSHMCVMYAYGLFERGLSREGNDVLRFLFEAASRHETAKIYPGIPEYFDSEGRGWYTYLTGSAAWYIFVLKEKVFGVQSRFGKLEIDPRIPKWLFGDQEKISIQVLHGGKKLTVEYKKDGSWKIR